MLVKNINTSDQTSSAIQGGNTLVQKVESFSYIKGAISFSIFAYDSYIIWKDYKTSKDEEKKLSMKYVMHSEDLSAFDGDDFEGGESEEEDEAIQQKKKERKKKMKKLNEKLKKAEKLKKKIEDGHKGRQRIML
jgi:hypothetical protein